jgi:hypothetical protein
MWALRTLLVTRASPCQWLGSQAPWGHVGDRPTAFRVAYPRNVLPGVSFSS